MLTIQLPLRRRVRSIATSTEEPPSNAGQGVQTIRVFVVDLLCLDDHDSDLPYFSYYDWKPIDIYKKRCSGFLPHRRLPWFTDDTVLHGNHILRFRSEGNVDTITFRAITGEVGE